VVLKINYLYLTRFNCTFTSGCIDGNKGKNHWEIKVNRFIKKFLAVYLKNFFNLK